MKKIEIVLDTDTGSISIWNDGAAIPVEKEVYTYTDPVTQKVTQDELYPAELYFGYMLAGTNYDDTLNRKTSGRNGMGAKAANVFSTAFEVDHASAASRKRLILRYADNVKVREPPKVSSYLRKTGYTRISFTPDYDFFKYEGRLDADLASVFEKLAYDTAMITGIRVLFNEKKVEVPTLEKYAGLYFPDANMVRFQAGSDEAVLVDTGTVPLDETGDLAHVSFVNGICTRDGGAHVKAWQDAIVTSFVRMYNSRKPKKGEKTVLKTTAREVFPYLCLFVKCELENPSFDSQTKDRLSAPAPSTTKLDKKTFEKICKWNFVQLLTEKLEEKYLRAQARKTVSGKRLMAFGKKAKDANWAGGKKSSECILFITEGQSAKSFADSGISKAKEGHDKYGSFAIKGKFINATNNSARRVTENQEAQALARILGLERGVDYTKPDNFKRLRYGKMCILADADDDGIHIRGLLLNFFISEYPSLWQRVLPFFTSMSTPTHIVTFKKKKVRYFYSAPDFLKWQTAYAGPSADIKYIKGLGTLTFQESGLEFLDPKTVVYWTEDTLAETKCVKLGFDGTESNLRKEWILKELEDKHEEKADESSAPVRGTQFKGTMSISAFINDHMIAYHCAAISRALPSVFDGLKESQRKIFYALLLKKLAKPIKVAQFSGFVSEKSGYHHGEVSL